MWTFFTPFPWLVPQNFVEANVLLLSRSNSPLNTLHRCSHDLGEEEIIRRYIGVKSYKLTHSHMIIPVYDKNVLFLINKFMSYMSFHLFPLLVIEDTVVKHHRTKIVIPRNINRIYVNNACTLIWLKKKKREKENVTVEPLISFQKKLYRLQSLKTGNNKSTWLSKSVHIEDKWSLTICTPYQL